MKTLSYYQQLKADLKDISDAAKRSYSGDTPAINEVINNYADYLCRCGGLSAREQNLLHNYACTLHPKN